MKRSINHKKYAKIKSLLQSSNKDDILIGVMLLKKTDFDYEDCCRNFPNNRIPVGFKTAYIGEFFWIDLGCTFLGVDLEIYCPRVEEQTVDDWRSYFKDEEIKL